MVNVLLLDFVRYFFFVQLYPASGRENEVKRVIARFDFNSDDVEELSFHRGDVIEVTGQENENWWRGRMPGGRTGLFPSNYVDLLPSVSWQFPARPNELLMIFFTTVPLPPLHPLSVRDQFHSIRHAARPLKSRNNSVSSIFRQFSLFLSIHWVYRTEPPLLRCWNPTVFCSISNHFLTSWLLIELSADSHPQCCISLWVTCVPHSHHWVINACISLPDHRLATSASHWLEFFSLPNLMTAVLSMQTTPWSLSCHHVFLLVFHIKPVPMAEFLWQRPGFPLADGTVKHMSHGFGFQRVSFSFIFDDSSVHQIFLPCFSYKVTRLLSSLID